LAAGDDGVGLQGDRDVGVLVEGGDQRPVLLGVLLGLGQQEFWRPGEGDVGDQGVGQPVAVDRFEGGDGQGDPPLEDPLLDEYPLVVDQLGDLVADTGPVELGG